MNIKHELHDWPYYSLYSVICVKAAQMSGYQRQVLVLLATAVLLLHPASAADTVLDNEITQCKV
jgi:hypothetical protein